MCLDSEHLVSTGDLKRHFICEPGIRSLWGRVFVNTGIVFEIMTPFWFWDGDSSSLKEDDNDTAESHSSGRCLKGV